MDSVIRGVIVYFFLLLIFRISGKRTLSEATVFDFVLLLIISETTQQALLADDYSITNGFLLITTLLIVDVGMSLFKQRFTAVEKILDGVPLIIIDNGKMLKERMKKSRVNESDIMESARELQGLENLDQIKYAILEKDGKITIIPKENK
ncbi:DUF421 domain-containing protein [Pontibacter vulgaris]|uniref:DUF421 domain-containing protein n=1 Tax=Pontibacter vulgaris TaxID=2905679 RepID=UPI001FA7CA31|nr:YetF domain-containing protein [Pontibacter vulgaris]